MESQNLIEKRILKIPLTQTLSSRYRIVAIATMAEKNSQGISYKMKHVMDPKTDNLVKFYYDNQRFYLIICVVLVYLD